MPVDVLRWDTRFFGFGVARVHHGALASDETAELLSSWAREHGISCLYLLADEAEAAIARRHAWLELDERVDLVAEAGDLQRPAHVHPAVPAENARLSALARTCFAKTRFRCDPGFPPHRVDELYARWLDRCMKEGEVLVAGDCEGFVGLSGSGEIVRIELLAVAPDAQGRGIGGELVQAALAAAKLGGRREVVVATQGDHEQALRAYAAAGFRELRRRRWFHAWF